MTIINISTLKNSSALGKIFSYYGARGLVSSKSSKYSNENETEKKNDDLIPKPDKTKFKKTSRPKKVDNLEEAADDVGTFLEQKSGKQKDVVKSELLNRLLGLETKIDQKPELNLRNLISGMQVETIDKEQTNFRGEYVRKTIDGMKKALFQRPNEGIANREKITPRSNTNSNLFRGKGLNLFKETVFEKPKTLCQTWDYLEEKELKASITHPPANYFEELILWTSQGKLWKFPINNEQNMEIESNVHFSEHIFLEQHLEGWCPTRGPIRHFMELVCVGLSKNPYITSQEKKDHIMWYKNYFEDKKELLKDLIVEESNKGEAKLH